MGPVRTGTGHVSSDDHRLRLQPDAEAAIDALLDGPCQGHHFRADGTAAIHQHQGLTFVDAGLPDGPLGHPEPVTNRQRLYFGVLIGLLIVGPALIDVWGAL